MASVLVIDDDAAVRALWADALAADGYEVRTASNGEQALRIVEETTIDVVITDILMPVMDGIETVVALRKCRPETPIIAISGGGAMWPHTYLESARRLGADMTFNKPVRINDLRKAVEACCSPDFMRGVA